MVRMEMGGGGVEKYGDFEGAKKTIRKRECLELESVNSGSTLVSFSDGDFPLLLFLSLQNISFR